MEKKNWIKPEMTLISSDETEGGISPGISEAEGGTIS